MSGRPSWRDARDARRQSTKLTTDMLMIADEYRPIGIAGVMGGANSEITDKTTTVVFESVNFNG